MTYLSNTLNTLIGKFGGRKEVGETFALGCCQLALKSIVRKIECG